MKYGDFSSLVQLGVGLHAGTALLQLYGELGLQPFMRSLERLRERRDNKSSPPKLADFDDELHQLEARFAVFRIRFFNSYKTSAKINLVVGIGLAVLLMVIAFIADELLSISGGILISAACLLPATITLAVLWWDASTNLSPLLKSAEKLESDADATQRAKTKMQSNS